MYKPLLLAAALAAGASTMPIGDPAAGEAAPTIVVIKDFSFGPATITIAPGTTVTWVNEDDSPHTVTDQGKTFRSAALDANERYSYTFAKAGEFTYYCTLHPMMVGKIIVKPAGASS